MYFNEKEDTNIDNEFKETNKKKKIKKYREKLKLIIPIAIGIIVLFFIILFFTTRKKYFLVLEGTNTMVIYQGSKYVEPGYKAYDNHQNRYDNEVTIAGEVNPSEIGTYTVSYKFRNRTVTRTVNVVAKPDIVTIIHLNGDINYHLNVGETYVEPGYSVVDVTDGDLTNNVVVNSNVDTSKKGTYRIIYSVVNSSGVTTSETRIVIVD